MVYMHIAWKQMVKVWEDVTLNYVRLLGYVTKKLTKIHTAYSKISVSQSSLIVNFFNNIFRLFFLPVKAWPSSANQHDLFPGLQGDHMKLPLVCNSTEHF